MQTIELFNKDCAVVIDQMIKEGIKVDLIHTDPNYEILNTKTGGKSKLNESFQKSQTEIEEMGITKGFDKTILEKLVLLQDKINMYFWCNKKQIPMYLDFFVNKLGCSFEIIKWVKTNPVPTFYNKYMSDTEYCLYFRKRGYCNPQSFEDGGTLFQHPINIKDKKLYDHPTIKPLSITEKLIRNSSREGETIFDPFMGSGTTGVASKSRMGVNPFNNPDFNNKEVA
jgi:site-specific DNA-methyltransferase (adenine-specific)